MGFGIRVKFSPTLRPKASGALDVLGGRIVLERLGEPPSEAARDSPKPAKLILHGAFLEKARNVSLPEFAELATLSGEIELRGTPPEAVFLLDPEGDFEYVEPEPEEGEPFRELRLDYDEFHFETPPEDGAPLTRLRLPREPEGSRFFELAVVLEIAGSTEAALEENHRLDVPLGPLPGPIFEWPEELNADLPPGLTLLLEEDGKRMAIDWTQGQVLGSLRRFVFSRLRGKGQCTLTAKSGGKDLVLLKDQVIDDPAAPIRWDHLLEELIVTTGSDGEEVVFDSAQPDISKDVLDTGEEET